jgi:hypothetical protein
MPALVSLRRTAVWMRRLQQVRGPIQLVDKDMKILRLMVSIPMSFDSGFANGHNVVAEFEVMVIEIDVVVEMIEIVMMKMMVLPERAKVVARSRRNGMASNRHSKTG